MNVTQALVKMVERAMMVLTRILAPASQDILEAIVK